MPKAPVIKTVLPTASYRKNAKVHVIASNTDTLVENFEGLKTFQTPGTHFGLYSTRNDQSEDIMSDKQSIHVTIEVSTENTQCIPGHLQIRQVKTYSQKLLVADGLVGCSHSICSGRAETLISSDKTRSQSVRNNGGDVCACHRYTTCHGTTLS